MSKKSVKAKPKTTAKAKTAKKKVASKSVAAKKAVTTKSVSAKKVSPKTAASSKKAPAAKVSKAKIKAAKVAPKIEAAPQAQPVEKNMTRESAMIRANKEALQAVAAEATEGKKRGRKVKVEESIAEEGLSKLGKKWASLYRKSDQGKVPAYNMRSVYEEKTSIQHKILGWGYILSNKNDRLEVLFKDGIRYLISNYKA